MSDFLSQVIATVIGATIGAIVAFITTRQANKATEARDLHQRKLIQKSALFKLQMRASLLVSDVANTMRTIDQMLVAANQEGRSGWPKHARIEPIVGPFDHISFPIEELEPLVEAKEFDLVHDLVEIGMRHHAFSEAISTYSRMRLELKNKVTIAGAEGSVLSANLGAQELKQLQPYLIELESLISQTISMGRDIEIQARDVVLKIGPAARKYLSDSTFPELIFTESPPK